MNCQIKMAFLSEQVNTKDKQKGVAHILLNSWIATLKEFVVNIVSRFVKYRVVLEVSNKLLQFELKSVITFDIERISTYRCFHLNKSCMSPQITENNIQEISPISYDLRNNKRSNGDPCTDESEEFNDTNSGDIAGAEEKNNRCNDCQENEDDGHCDLEAFEHKCQISGKSNTTINEKSDGYSTISTLESGILPDINNDNSQTINKLTDTINQLKSEIDQLKVEIATKDHQLSVMRTFQSDASMEIEDLTSALFTEAYKMVNTEKNRFCIKEKECEELRSELKQLQAEKRSMSSIGFESNFNMSMHTYMPMHLSNTDISENSKEGRSMMNILKKNFKKKNIPFSELTILVDPTVYQAFRNWLLDEQRSTSSDFFKQIVETDMRPNCIFPSSQDSNFLLDAILNRNLEICKLTAVEVSQATQDHVRCSLCPAISDVEYKFRILVNNNGLWKMISAFAAKRIQTVYDLYHFLISDDFSRQEYQNVYKNLINKRRLLLISRIGYPTA
ncbi:hypothetical protein GJ496_004132 [Pomphorhynchus laevis]|nr:hypothetical protein GJ496_004132 [Pomphorhynchus laevis]